MPSDDVMITIRHEKGNTLRGTVQQVLAHHLAEGWKLESGPELRKEHPAHTGHRFGGGYARASAMLAGDPDWMNATGGETERPAEPEITDAEVRAAAYSMYSSECRRQGRSKPTMRMEEGGWSEAAWSKVARDALEAARKARL